MTGRSVSGAMRRGARAPLVLAMTLLAGGCAQLGPAEKRMLQEAAGLYGRGDVQSASARCDRLIRQFGDAAEIGEAYYIRGLCRVKCRQMKAASDDFQMAIRKSKREDLEALSRASLGTLAYQAGAWSTAHEQFEEALPKLPNTPPKDDLLYTAGVSAQRAGEWKDASRCFREILWRFAGRPIAAEARRRAQWRHPYFAIQLGVFRNSTNAAEFVNQWRQHRVDAVQENMPRGGEAVWVVMAGRYATYSDARHGLERIRPLQPGAFIIP